MSGSIYGNFFQISTFGESHGPALGVVIDGVTPDIRLDVTAIQRELDRRKPGQSKLTTQRREGDLVEILSGLFEGKTTGTPLAMLIRNHDARSSDYRNLAGLFRPGHADYTYFKKYANRDYRGGGRSSGRETAARVAAGAVAKQLLAAKGVTLFSHTLQIGAVKCTTFNREEVENNPVRCGDAAAAEQMIRAIETAQANRDSVGGIVECRIAGVPAGWGEPVFDRLDAELGKGALSIGGVKGVEFGAGFQAAAMSGSQHNDQFGPDGWQSNHAGGILGGISSGAEIVFRVAVKPTASIARRQATIALDGTPVACEIRGRHDPCLCPRLGVVLEAMSAIVLIDMCKRQAALLA
ncbi:chorismate synthase [Victivallis sp. Marseille-Q1083]|uniref:chorismate synthase n=1 Tax=Victivallis sp. Marseille-Q1083 TaxID=2717288 RepID=UPI00158C96DD|nr:chorismate synthase [Victivallis sp. Marseille-Q1083]